MGLGSRIQWRQIQMKHLCGLPVGVLHGDGKGIGREVFCGYHGPDPVHGRDVLGVLVVEDRVSEGERRHLWNCKIKAGIFFARLEPNSNINFCLSQVDFMGEVFSTLLEPGV